MSRTYCIFSASYLPHMGGVESYTKNIAVELAYRGNTVFIVTSRLPGLPAKEYTDDGITLYRLPCHELLNGRLPIPKKNREYKALMNEIENLDIDYFVVNTRFYPHSLEGLKLAERKNRVPVLIEHGSAHLTLANKALDVFIDVYEHAITHFVKRRKPKFYAVSKKGSEWLLHFGIKSSGELYNSINVDEFNGESSKRDFRQELSLPESTFIATYFGRLIPEKGVGQLMEAADRLSESDKDITFIIAGEGPLLDDLNTFKRKNVNYVGRLTSSDVAALLQCSNVFCLPSRSEGFATSLLEASACCTPSIVSDVGGAAELIVDDSYGIILNSPSASNIITALLRFYDNPEYAARAGKNVYERTKEYFSWCKTAELLEIACKRANEGRG